MNKQEHFLMKFLEKHVTSCPLCEKEGTFSKVYWELHPVDSKSQNVGDRCLGHCHNGHNIFCHVQPYICEMNSDEEYNLDPWGRIIK
jgi:hypothetical protein